MKSKKLLSFFLAVVMLVTIAVPAFALTGSVDMIYIQEPNGTIVAFSTFDLATNPSIRKAYNEWLMKSAEEGGGVFVSTTDGVVVKYDSTAEEDLATQLKNADENNDVTGDVADAYFAVNAAEDGTVVVSDTKAGEPVGSIPEPGGEVSTEIPPVEPTAAEKLEAAKATAEELSEEDYTEASWAGLVAALAMPEDTGDEMLAKATAILAAIEALEIIPSETPGADALEAAMERYEALVEEAYTADSWAAFEEAMVDILAMPEETDEEMQDKADAINGAIAALEPVVIPEPTDEFALVSVVPVVSEDTITVTATFENVPESEEGIEVEFYLFSGDTEIEFNETATAAIDEDGIAEVEFVGLTDGSYSVTVTVEDYEDITETKENIIVGSSGDETVKEKLEKAAAAAEDALDELDIDAVAHDADALAELKETLEGLAEELEEAYDAYKNDEAYEENAEYEAEVEEVLADLSNAIDEVDAAIELLEATNVTDVEVVSAVAVKVTMVYDNLKKDAFKVALTETPTTEVVVESVPYTTATADVPGFYTLNLKAPGLSVNADYTLTITLDGKVIYDESGLVNEQLEAISGIVQAKQEDAPTASAEALAGALVTIKCDGQVVDTQTTDENGEFESVELINDISKVYTITVTADGYTEFNLPNSISPAPVVTGSLASPITLLSNSTKLFSNNADVSVIDVENKIIFVKEAAVPGTAPQSNTVAGTLTVQYNGKNFVMNKKGETTDIAKFARDLASEDVVIVTAEDRVTVATYTIEILSDQAFKEERLTAVKLEPGSAPGTINILNMASGMKYQIINSGESAKTSGNTEYLHTHSVDIPVNVGQKIVVYIGTYAPNATYVELEVRQSDVSKATAPSVSVGTIKQGDINNTATFTVTGAAATMEYFVGAAADEKVAWTKFTQSGTVEIKDVPANVGDYVFIRTSETTTTPASAYYTSAVLQVKPNSINAQLAAGATSGTKINGLTSTTTTYQFKIFEVSQDTAALRPAKGTSAASLGYTAIQSPDFEIATVAADVNKYLAIAEIGSGETANTVVSWTQVQLTDAVVKQNISNGEIVSAIAVVDTAALSINNTHAGVSKLTADLGTGNTLWISLAKTTNIPTNWIVGKDFADTDKYEEVTDATLYKFKEGAGKYVAVELTPAGKIKRAQVLDVTTAMITHVIKINNASAHTSISVDGKTLTANVAGPYGVGFTNYIKLAAPYSGAKITFGNSATFASATATIEKDIGSPDANYMYTVNIGAQELWEFMLGKAINTTQTVYTIVQTPTAGDNITVGLTNIQIGAGGTGNTYALPTNPSIRSALENLRVGDQISVLNNKLGKIIVNSANGATYDGTRAVTVFDADCVGSGPALEITGGTTAARTLLITAGDLTPVTTLTIKGGYVKFETARFATVAVAATSTETNITAVTGQTFTGIGSAESSDVTINGIKAIATSATPNIKVTANGLSVDASGNAINIDASTAANDVTFTFTVPVGGSIAQSGQVTLKGPTAEGKKLTLVTNPTGGITAAVELQGGTFDLTNAKLTGPGAGVTVTAASTVVGTLAVPGSATLTVNTGNTKDLTIASGATLICASATVDNSAKVIFKAGATYKLTDTITYVSPNASGTFYKLESGELHLTAATATSYTIELVNNTVAVLVNDVAGTGIEGIGSNTAESGSGTTDKVIINGTDAVLRIPELKTLRICGIASQIIVTKGTLDILGTLELDLQKATGSLVNAIDVDQHGLLNIGSAGVIAMSSADWGSALSAQAEFNGIRIHASANVTKANNAVKFYPGDSNTELTTSAIAGKTFKWAAAAGGAGNAGWKATA